MISQLASYTNIKDHDILIQLMTINVHLTMIPELQEIACYSAELLISFEGGSEMIENA